MTTSIHTLTLVVPDRHTEAPLINDLLSKNGDHILSRLGLPLNGRPFSIITVVFESPSDVFDTLAAQLRKIDGVQVHTVKV